MSDSDQDLLRRFADDHVQEAFTEIVRRHVNLVYSAALRQVRSSQLAEDVAQSVFCDLAKNAQKLCATDSLPVLTAWLYQVTHRTAVDVVRQESRRQLREQIAAEMNSVNTTDASWNQIEPFLDEAMQSLDSTDRTAVLLRYFENKSLSEVGQQLGVSDDAAQKRVSRAVDRLREFFSKRNVTIGAGGLVAMISANSVQSAPVGLALTIANASLAGAGTTLAFMKIATATKLKLALSAAVIASVVAVFVLQQQNQTKLHDENNLLRQHIAQLRLDNENLSNRIDEIGVLKKLPNEQFNELLKLRGEVGVLRRQLDEASAQNRRSQYVNIVTHDSKTNPPLPQVHIKARFIAIPKGTTWSFNVLGTKISNKGNFAGILTDKNYRIVLKQLQSHNGVETLAEPEVLTISGRQVQMRATQTISVVTNFCLQETNGVSNIVPQTENVEAGPVLGAIPRVLPDGYTIELPVNASVTDFLGYSPSSKTTPAYDSNGQEFDVPTASPQFHTQQATNSVNLLDGQTLLLILNGSQISANATFIEPDGSTSKYRDLKTYVFITPTIIDLAGNRVHADAGTYTNVPSQMSNQ